MPHRDRGWGSHCPPISCSFVTWGWWMNVAKFSVCGISASRSRAGLRLCRHSLCPGPRGEAQFAAQAITRLMGWSWERGRLPESLWEWELSLLPQPALSFYTFLSQSNEAFHSSTLSLSLCNGNYLLCLPCTQAALQLGVKNPVDPVVARATRGTAGGCHQ
ncbi:hypothetical protein DV515_00015124 [Chloebia gouldiae]|uniref:Uncharacterized protein n=1 Tax=Chloebia gouldiae TaxID=44316 RepID=A0A3L8RXR2_CHLGU|nr:hypothetical protein DV515_00015124 [Chloebia gouldiae]